MSVARFKLRSAVYLLPIRENKVLLSRRFNTGWMDGMYSLVAGHIDGNEPVTQAMIREAAEEVGIIVTKQDLKLATVIHRKTSDQEYIDFFFVTKHWTGEPKIKELDKCDDLSWVSLDNLPENIL